MSEKKAIQLISGESGAPVVREIDAGASGITPGHLLTIGASSAVVHASSGVKTPPVFALENMVVAGTIDDAYTSGDTLSYGRFSSGQEVNALVAIGTAAIALNDYVASSGDGTLVTVTPAAAAAVTIVGEADANGTLLFTANDAGSDGNDLEIVLNDAAILTAVAASVTVTGEADVDGSVLFTANDAGTDGNDIEIVLVDAGTGGIVVDGLTITITPDTGTNTATGVVALVAGSVAASNLITATLPGTGATEPGTSASSPLVGGLEAVEGVVVDGLTITITPATGSNTATDVIAQVAASVAASNLITATAPGTGATEPGTSASSPLVDGTDLGSGVIGVALEAVDNSAGSALARIAISID